MEQGKKGIGGGIQALIRAKDATVKFGEEAISRQQERMLQASLDQQMNSLSAALLFIDRLAGTGRIKDPEGIKDQARALLSQIHFLNEKNDENEKNEEETL